MTYLSKRNFLIGAATLPILTRPGHVNGQDAGLARFPATIPDLNPSTFEMIAGLRPTRDVKGVRLQWGSPISGKKIFHNYGHGGGGITLSWGCALHVVNQLLIEPGIERESSIAVLGSGIIGLTTALAIADSERFRNKRVTIHTMDIDRTTSHVAGGQFYPSGERRVVKRFWEANPGYTNSDVISLATFDRIVKASYAHFDAERSRNVGVRKVTNFKLVRRGEPETLVDFPDGFRDLRPLDRPYFGSMSATVRYFETLLIETPIYLPALKRRVEALTPRVQIVRQTIDQAALRQIPSNVIVNCLGLGSKRLFEDSELNGVKGNLVILKPDARVDYLFSGEPGEKDWYEYMFSRRDGIIVGGTGEHVYLDDRPDAVIGRRILERMRITLSGGDAPGEISPFDTYPAEMRQMILASRDRMLRGGPVMPASLRPRRPTFARA
jgi:D-amino-acid oxidase